MTEEQGHMIETLALLSRKQDGIPHSRRASYLELQQRGILGAAIELYKRGYLNRSEEPGGAGTSDSASFYSLNPRGARLASDLCEFLENHMDS